MKTFAFNVESHESPLMPGREEVTIVGFGDLQADPNLRGKPRAADFDRARRVLEWGAEHGAYFVGMGDYVDAMSPSNRVSWLGAKLYDSPRDAMDEMSYQVLDEVAELMGIAEGRWLGLLSGHHYHEFQDGTRSDHLLAQRLGTKHFGDGVVGMSLFLPPRSKHRRPRVNVWAAHGRSSNARSAAAAITELTKLSAWNEDVDAFLVGHYHQAEFKKIQKLRWAGGERGGEPWLVHRDVVVGCTGSFLRGYRQDNRDEARETYVEAGLMPPSALGSIAVFARPRYGEGSKVHIDMDAVTL